MIGFSEQELIISALYAVIYGILFSFAYRLFSILIHVIKEAPRLCSEVVFANKIFPAVKINSRLGNGKNGPISAFFSTVLYFIGFLLLSYFCLDGQLRVYMLVISSASLYVFNFAFFVILSRIAIILTDGILFLVSTAVRLVILPFKFIFTVNRKVK